MNQSQYAKHRGISQQRVAKLIQQGKIKKGVKKKGNVYSIDPVKADAELEGNLAPINRPKPKKSEPKPKSGKRSKKKDPPQAEMQNTAKEGGTVGMSYNTAHTLHEQYRAALRRLEYEEKKAELIPAESVRKDADALGRLVKGLFTAMPPRTAPLLAAESDPFKVQQMMIKEINQILDEISDTLLGITN